MGKIRFFFAASLDGYIADPEGGVEFLDAIEDNEDDASEGDDDGYETFFSDIGTLVMGRGTYSSSKTTKLGRILRCARSC